MDPTAPDPQPPQLQAPPPAPHQPQQLQPPPSAPHQPPPPQLQAPPPAPHQPQQLQGPPPAPHYYPHYYSHYYPHHPQQIQPHPPHPQAPYATGPPPPQPPHPQQAGPPMYWPHPPPHHQQQPQPHPIQYHPNHNPQPHPMTQNPYTQYPHYYSHHPQQMQPHPAHPQSPYAPGPPAPPPTSYPQQPGSAMYWPHPQAHPHPHQQPHPHAHPQPHPHSHPQAPQPHPHQPHWVHGPHPPQPPPQQIPHAPQPAYYSTPPAQHQSGSQTPTRPPQYPPQSPTPIRPLTPQHTPTNQTPPRTTQYPTPSQTPTWPPPPPQHPQAQPHPPPQAPQHPQAQHPPLPHPPQQHPPVQHPPPQHPPVQHPPPQHPPVQHQPPQLPQPPPPPPPQQLQPQVQPPPSHPPQSSTPKKEITFPKNCVEATKPITNKKRRLTSKDVTDIEVWRLLMCLRSGLLAESSWAIDVLSILLNDDSTFMYFNLHNMPGLLDSVLEHFKKCLKELFKGIFKDADCPNFIDWIQVYFEDDNFIESSRRCTCLSTIIRDLSFIPGNDAEMSKHSGLLLVLGRLLLLKHDEIVQNEQDKSPSEWYLLSSLREDSLVVISNISSSLDLSPYNDNLNLSLLDGLLHWACCTSSYALDPFPPPSVSVSPQRLALESLAKLSILEGNVDLILATPPWSRIEKLFEVLIGLLNINEDQTIREFSLVLLSNLTAADSGIARKVALTGSAIPRLLSFLETSEAQATTQDMLRRAATTLKFLSQIVDNHPLFSQHQQRLLNLVMSQKLDQEVVPIIADVIFEISLSD